MTNILFTGTKGFIASHLARQLSRNPRNRIYGLHRSSIYNTFDALGLEKVKNISLVLGDVRDYHTMVEIISDNDIDQIYHLAAQPIVQKASQHPVGTYEINVFGTVNILEAVRTLRETEDKKNRPVLVMSSDKAYGPSQNLPYTEDHALAITGTDIYSSSKACADVIARAYAYNYDMPVVVARSANTYGELDFNGTRLIPSLMRAYYTEVSNLVLNKGSYHYLREWNYVEDTVRALEDLMIALKYREPGEEFYPGGRAFNISSGCVHTIEEVVSKFIELTGFSKPVEFREKKHTFKEIEKQYLDGSRLQSLTPWRPKFDLEKGLKKTIEGYGGFYAGAGGEACR